MTTLNILQERHAADLALLNERIARQLDSTNPLMRQVVAAQLRTKGKQLRPLLLMVCARMFGSVTPDVLAAAAAVELLHNASLIHDDVVDDSKMRRRQPTINAVWDNHIAVLVGDFFVSTALQRAIATGDLRIINEIGKLGKLLSLGEIDQIYNAREHTLNEEAYFKIIDYKTASLFVACARVGCYSVGASDADTNTLSEIARLLGLCFQIRDDVFDYFDADTVGKPTGNDLREGKITLPLLYALGHNDDEAMHALTAQECLADSDIAILTAFARNKGGIEYAYNRMAQLRDQAVALLDRLPACPAADQLRQLFDYIITRDF